MTTPLAVRPLIWIAHRMADIGRGIGIATGYIFTAHHHDESWRP